MRKECQALSHNFVESRSDVQTNYFFPSGSYKLCPKASVVLGEPQWMLSIRSEMKGMVIDLDHRIGLFLFLYFFSRKKFFFRISFFLDIYLVACRLIPLWFIRKGTARNWNKITCPKVAWTSLSNVYSLNYFRNLFWRFLGKLTKLLVNTFSAFGENEESDYRDIEDEQSPDPGVEKVEGAGELMSLPMDKRVPWLERKVRFWIVFFFHF